MLAQVWRLHVKDGERGARLGAARHPGGIAHTLYFADRCSLLFIYFLSFEGTRVELARRHQRSLNSLMSVSCL